MTTGCLVLDELIGSLEKDVLTTIYGLGGSGKTLFCMLAAAQVAKEGGKVLYVDTEGGFSTERFKQVTGNEFDKLLGNITFLKPTSFEEQQKVFANLKENISENIKLVVVDTIAMLYRLELGKEEIFEMNRVLGRQLATLSEIARNNTIPVIVTNQVYHNLDGRGVRMVGGDLLVYGSKCLIELEKVGSNRRAKLKKHRSKEEKIVNFQIVPEGVHNYPQ